MMRFRWILFLAGLLLVASAIAGVAQPHFGRSATTPTTAPPAKTITVTGNGSVTTVPDRATFDFAIETRANARGVPGDVAHRGIHLAESQAHFEASLSGQLCTAGGLPTEGRRA